MPYRKRAIWKKEPNRKKKKRGTKRKKGHIVKRRNRKEKKKSHTAIRKRAISLHRGDFWKNDSFTFFTGRRKHTFFIGRIKKRLVESRQLIKEPIFLLIVFTVIEASRTVNEFNIHFEWVQYPNLTGMFWNFQNLFYTKKYFFWKLREGR